MLQLFKFGGPPPIARVPRLNWALGAVWAQDEAGCSAIPAGGGEGALGGAQVLGGGWLGSSLEH